jgi:predicted DNA-binding protein (MmcQ/YjbR family)
MRRPASQRLSISEMKRKPAASGSSARKNERALREFALQFPESYEEFPWGHSAIKVRKKIFLSLSTSDDGLSMSVKLPHSGHEALLLPFTEPTHYGMGKHGWVSARFGPKDHPPMPILRDWVEESYRTIAPKKLVALLDDAQAAPAEQTVARKVKKKTVARKAKKKTVARKAKKKTVARKVKKKTAAPKVKRKTP